MARRGMGRGGSDRAGAPAGRGGKTPGREAQRGQRPQRRGAGAPYRAQQGGRSQQGRGAGARTGQGRPQGGAPRRPDRASDVTRDDLVEGRRATEEALELGLPIRRALVQKDGGQQDPALARLAARLVEAGVEVEYVARPVLDSLSSHGAHQGVVLRVSPYRYAELADIIKAAGEGDALVVVLDHVTDEGNFGAIVRTAEVVGAAGVVIAKARAARVGVGAYKTSAGAVMHLPIAQAPNLASALDQLKEAGFWVGGATEHARDVIWDAPVAGRLALVMGSEGSGISRLVRQRCDFEFRLPQRGHVESLNVAQATTAICYEWLRRSMRGEGTGTAAPGLSLDLAVDEAPAGDGLDEYLGEDFPDTSDFDFGDEPRG